MSVKFIVGKPGGGKSMFGTKLIIEDLVYTGATIVTNIPLKLPELNEYIQKKYPKADVDIHERVVILDEDDVFEFYRFRSGGLVLRPSPDAETDEDGKKKKLRKAEFIQAMKANFDEMRLFPEYRKPCHYYIDEAHNFFNAREWMEIGRGLLYYVSQHRHLHDNIVLLTQALGNVEKQLKSVTQEYHVLRNLYKESFGPFKQSGGFRRRMYYAEPTPTSDYNEQATYKLDAAGIANCYVSCGAISIGQEQVETDRQPRKLPYWTMWAAAVAAIVLVSAGIAIVPGKLTNVLVGPVVEPMKQRANEPPSVHMAMASPGELAARPQAFDQPPAVKPHVVEYVNMGGVHRVALSDGRRFRTDRTNEIERITRDYVVILGEAYFFK